MLTKLRAALADPWTKGLVIAAVAAAITTFVLLEKLAPYGVQGGRLSGTALVLAGVWVLASA